MERKQRDLKTLISAALMSAFTVICSWISIPFAIPITLQLASLILSLLLLGGKIGTLSFAVYLAIGAIGLPVFSGFGGGIGYLFGATGGFLFGMLIGSITYAFLEAVLPKSDKTKFVLSIILIIIVYIIGTLWFSLVYASESVGGILSALTVCVLPYILPDTIKLTLAFIIYKRLKKHINLTE